MRPPLDGTALVTGASSGLGRELARQLAPRAAGLVLVARRVERLQGLRDELRAAHPGLEVHVRPCDLADPGAVEALLEDLDRSVAPIDVLVNCAGSGHMGAFDRSPWARVEEMLRVNVWALARLTHHLLPRMIARGRGGVLNVSSGFGLEILPDFAAYCGTKHFVTAFTETLRLEARAAGVVVTQVCPGPVASEFIDGIGNFTGRQVPGWLLQRPDACARAAVRGFARGRALVVPALPIRLLLLLGAVSPRVLKRALYAPLARALRGLEERRRAAALEDRSRT